MLCQFYLYLLTSAAGEPFLFIPVLLHETVSVLMRTQVTGCALSGQMSAVVGPSGVCFDESVATQREVGVQPMCA